MVVLDGDSWEMSVALADCTCITSAGDNDYPETFDDFVSALMKLGFPDFWA